MIEILETVSPEAVAVSAKGTVTMEDYRKVTPLILGKIAVFGKIPVLLSLKDIDTMASKEVWHGLKADVSHLKDFKRLAIIVDSLKFKLMVQMAKPFIPVEMKVFDEGDEQQALKWVMG